MCVNASLLYTIATSLGGRTLYLGQYLVPTSALVPPQDMRHDWVLMNLLLLDKSWYRKLLCVWHNNDIDVCNFYQHTITLSRYVSTDAPCVCKWFIHVFIMRKFTEVFPIFFKRGYHACSLCVVGSQPLWRGTVNLTTESFGASEIHSQPWRLPNIW